ncbi:MAG TPA: hypothetical protein DEG42_05670, partial [Acholeplasmataceae bacterium]|nr:hypothetical protein [Acholeplasmataceae bacterium]
MEINASIKIKSIKRIKLEKPIDVYDLHVKKNHNFPIGKSGICVHNCTQYLHGEQSLGGVICGLAQDFVGTNNITLMIPDGTFGSRLKPAPSATRYIFTYKAPVFNQIFNKDDIPLLTEQVFEGDVIEPRFFVPTLPLILINGSEGIGSGWSQKILPRDSKEVTKHIRNYLKNGKLPQRIAPYYKGFNGVIEYEAEKNRWLIKGDFEKVNRTTLRITELPIGYDLDKYVKVLTELEEKKVIRDFDDLSNPGNSKFEFIVKVTSEFIDRDKEIVLNDLKL